MTDDKTRQAHDLAERALDKAAEGDEAAGKRLADKARKLDPKGAKQLAEEVEKEREAAEHFEEKR